MELTAEQQLIVDHAHGHAKVSAVAGSGKTTTMVARVRHLLRQGVAPRRIMVLMFNRSARDAFHLSLAQALKPTGLTSPEVRTFHSLGLRLVASFSKRGVIPVRTLLTADHQLERLAKEAVKRAMERDADIGDGLAKENMEGFLTFIDLVKAHTLPAAQLFAQLGLPEPLAYFIDAFALFEGLRQERRVRFYADLIHEPVLALAADPALAQWVGNHVDHIIVDEYQDINEVQQQLLTAIAGERAQVMVVGDVDQCIYEWRGARPEYITTRFQEEFPSPVAYTLSYTFRFGHRLSLAANHLIRNNRLAERKLCRSFPGSYDTVFHSLAEGDPHPILAILAQWQEQGRALNEAAALVRIFAMSVPLELALLEAGIPYRLLGHERVFACPEIMALTGFLRLCHGERELPAETVEAMLANPHLGLKRERLAPLARAIAAAPSEAPELILGQIDRDTPPFLKRQLEERAGVWHEIKRLPAGAKAHDLLTSILNKTGLFAFYRGFSSRIALADNKIKTCQALVGFAKRHNRPLGPFLNEIDRLQAEEMDPEGDSLLITSIHRAKGLEWPLVVIPGLEEGSFPGLDDHPETVLANQEDERRLCYVAMTRAREQLFFIHPPDPQLAREQRAGASGFSPPNQDAPLASRFLYEANLDLSSRLGAAIHGLETPQPPIHAVDHELANSYLAAIASPLPRVQPPLPECPNRPPDPEDFLKTNEMAAGMMVVHHTFGTGVITAVPDRRRGQVEVLFPRHGKKLLIADIARLCNYTGE